MRYRYCPECGEKLTRKKAGDNGMVPYCRSCDKLWFDTFKGCVIVLVYDQYEEMVLTKQSHLSMEYTTITSGFMCPGETAEESAKREVEEELGLKIKELEYGGTHWFPNEDMLMHAFLAYVPKRKLVPSQEVAEAYGVPVREATKTMFPDRPGNAMYALYRMLLKKLGIKEKDVIPKK